MEFSLECLETLMMAQSEAPEVPANQVVEKVLKTHLNHAFKEKAEALEQKLHEWTDTPLSVIEFQSDPKEFFNNKAIQTHTIKELSSIPYGKGEQFILDFGSHRVGYLSFHLGVEGVNIDAPARL